MAVTPSPPFDLAALAGFLAAASGAHRIDIGRVELLPGGAIQENWGFDAYFAGGSLAGAQRLVLRTNAATRIPSSLGPTEEFAVLRAAHDAGVAVAKPLFAGADPDVLDRPFFVMRRLPGNAQGRWITGDPALEAALPQIAARLAQELARLQTIRPPHPDLAFLPLVGAAEHITSFRAYLDRHPQPRPVLEWAVRWLETHLPDPLSPVLCHRDFRTGNYLVDGAELMAILDWEFAGWGDPDEDIGWLCCKGWRFARLDREAGGIVPRELFYGEYERASGRRLDPARVFFWEVLANVRWAIIALQQSDRHLIGGARDLTTAIIGRRAAESELELLLLLDPRPDPPPLAGEGRVGAAGRAAPPSMWRDRPSGAGLQPLARELLLEKLLPLLPPEREREARLVVTAMAIAERETAIGDTPAHEIALHLRVLYGDGELEALLARFAADLRAGAFEPCEARAEAARALLWRLAITRLREGNPGFLAAHGFE